MDDNIELIEDADWDDNGGFGDGKPDESVLVQHFGNALFDTHQKLFDRQMWNSPKGIADTILYHLIGQSPNIRRRYFTIWDCIYDHRIFVAIFIDSGSGKGKMLNHLGRLANMMGMNFYILGTITDAALVGRRKTESVWSNVTEKKEKEEEEILGVLDPRSGHDIVAMGETDDLFNSPKSLHSQGLMIIFQKAMNAYGTFDNVVSSDTITSGRIEFYSDAGCFFTSKLPKRFYHTLTSMGFLQRCIVRNIPKTYKEKRKDDEQMMAGVGVSVTEECDAMYDSVANALIKINEFYKDAPDLEFSEAALEMLQGKVVAKIHDPLEEMSEHVREIIQTFTSRYQEQVVRIAHLNAMTRLSMKVEKQDVARAVLFVMPVWENIIYFIESGLKKESKDKLEELRDRKKFIDVYNAVRRAANKKAQKLGKQTSDMAPLHIIIRFLCGKKHGWNCTTRTARRRADRVLQGGPWEITKEGNLIWVKLCEETTIEEEVEEKSKPRKG